MKARYSKVRAEDHAHSGHDDLLYFDISFNVELSEWNENKSHQNEKTKIYIINGYEAMQLRNT